MRHRVSVYLPTLFFFVLPFVLLNGMYEQLVVFRERPMKVKSHVDASVWRPFRAERITTTLPQRIKSLSLWFALFRSFFSALLQSASNQRLNKYVAGKKYNKRIVTK